MLFSQLHSFLIGHRNWTKVLRNSFFFPLLFFVASCNCFSSYNFKINLKYFFFFAFSEFIIFAPAIIIFNLNFSFFTTAFGCAVQKKSLIVKKCCIANRNTCHNGDVLQRLDCIKKVKRFLCYRFNSVLFSIIFHSMWPAGIQRAYVNKRKRI